MNKKILAVISAVVLVAIGVAIGFMAGKKAINDSMNMNFGNVGSGSEVQGTDTEQGEGLQENSEVALVGQDTNGKTDGSALHVEGTLLKDKNGNTVQLKGISTHGINWYPEYVNQKCFKELHEEWGINVIRLSMYTADHNGYCSDGDKEQLKQIIFDGVEYATREGMYVIIDWHILSDGNPHTYIDEAKAFFDEVSKKYANHTNVFYEICNEPNGDVGWSEIRSYAQDIISVIRKNDQYGIILVGTPQWSQLVGQVVKDPITNYENIMYTLHFYADTHRDSLRQELESAVQSGLPIFVSEYGICEASGNGANNTQEADKWMDLLDRYSISCVAWSLANKNETCSLLSADCNKTSGFTQDDLSESGLWLKAMLLGHEYNSEDYAYYNARVVAYDNDLLRVTATPTDTWENGDNVSCNYSVVVENLSDEVINGWEIDLSFSDEIVDVQGWCGEFTFEGNTLHIKNADFNGQIQAKAKAQDIGFIVTGPSGICIEEK